MEDSFCLAHYSADGDYPEFLSVPDHLLDLILDDDVSFDEVTPEFEDVADKLTSDGEAVQLVYWEGDGSPFETTRTFTKGDCSNLDLKD